MMNDNTIISTEYLETFAISMGESIPEEIKNSISFNISGIEMLKVASDGFYVRGEKAPIDQNEANTVYHAFRHWLTLTALYTNYT